jgi:NAD(P)-dependent dehydrogenase (short-subunit alcohol dehydrogenase family)
MTIPPFRDVVPRDEVHPCALPQVFGGPGYVVTFESMGAFGAPVANAVFAPGEGNETSFLNISIEEWRRVLDVNLTGMFVVA